MSYHASRSLNLLHDLVGEESDSSSEQEWKEGGNLAESGTGANKTAKISVSIVRSPKAFAEDTKSDNTKSVTDSRMNKMGNSVDSFPGLENEEEINRKYEQFLRGGQLMESGAEEELENCREEMLGKIEEEAEDFWSESHEKSEQRRKNHKDSRSRSHKEHHRHSERKPQLENPDNEKLKREEEYLENDSISKAEESVSDKTVKQKKKKRRVKKAFVVESEEQEGVKQNGGYQKERIDQENHARQDARLGKREESIDQESVGERHEIMSDQGPSTQNQKKRKLGKRTQLRKFRSLEINPDLFYEERLQQKYEELKELVETGISQKQVSRQYLRQMEKLRQQYGNVSHGIPPSGRSHNQQPESDHAYSTIRMLQVSNQSRFSRSRPHSAAPVRQEYSRSTQQLRPKSAAPARQDQSIERTRYTSGSGNFRSSNQNIRNRSYSPGNKKQYSVTDSPRSKSVDSDSTSEGHSHLHGDFPHADHQLKNTDNEAIREWLKKKNVLIRKQKAEERRKRREEKKKELALAKEKEKKKLEAREKYQEWLKAKRKEALKKGKEDRYQKKQQMEENNMYEAYHVTMVSGQGFNFPPSPPLYKTKHVIRPGTTMADVRSKKQTELADTGEEITEHMRSEMTRKKLEEEEKQQKAVAEKIQVEGPRPPATKFVYKRPVLGRVRLRVKQQQTSDKKNEMKIETQIKRDEMKARKSYDEWVAEKRLSSNKLNKNNSMQNKMAKSDPELDRRDLKLNEENDSNTDENKKSNVDDLDEITHKLVSEVLSSLEDEEIEETEDNKITEEDSSLRVSGSKASLSTRPKSAATVPVPSLLMSKSPRRPASAKPQTKALKENEEVRCKSPAFKLPFPPDLGVPKYVEARQRKLFSPKLWENPQGSERPEPQGCDANEQTSASMVSEESPKDSPTDANASVSHESLKFKRVSFSETTTVIEDDFPTTENPGNEEPSVNAETPGGEEHSSQNTDSEKELLSDKIFITEDS